MEPVMNQASLLVLARYNAYANRLVLACAAQLDEAELTRRASPSHDSVRDLLRHMLMVEAGFLARCRGQRGTPVEAQTVAALETAWQQMAHETELFLAAVGDDELTRALPVPLRDQTFQFAPWQILLQAFTHSAHHRGELSIVLTELGYPLPTLDAIVYLAEQSGQPWPWPEA